MRTIKRILPAKYCPIDDLITYSPLPSSTVDQIDPFLVLNHLGPQRYIPDNNGLPFIPHTLCGINIFSIILEGETIFDDLNGNMNLVKAGGYHWINAGSGINYFEESSEEFTEKGGRLEVLQVWINLPFKYRMTTPEYVGIMNEQIPSFMEDDQKVRIRLLSGTMKNKSGVIKTSPDITMALINLATDGNIRLSIPVEMNIFLYVIRGVLNVDNHRISKLNLIEFNMDHEYVDIRAEKESMILLAYASPVAESQDHIRSHLALVEEIRQSCREFYRGRMGLI